MEPTMLKTRCTWLSFATLKKQAGKVVRPVYITSHQYCDDKKSIYQIEEEGKKPRMVHGKPYPEWRQRWGERQGEWTSKLAVFKFANPSADILNSLHKIPNLDLKQVKDWWSRMKSIQETHNQRYVPERTGTLGANLAAMHFFIYRHCGIRLKDSKDWLTGNMPQLSLPSVYEDGYFVEAVDCTNFHRNGIRYEGLQNLSGLNFLKWLSLSGNKHVDVWCLDRIAGQNGKTLEYLDITGLQLCVGSIFALARMPALRMLVITDPGDNLDVQAGLSMLEEENPKLVIKMVDPKDCNTLEDSSETKHSKRIEGSTG